MPRDGTDSENPLQCKCTRSFLFTFAHRKVEKASQNQQDLYVFFEKWSPF